MKTCRKCNQVKSKDEFSFTNKAKGYRKSICKKCFAEYYRKYQNDNRQKLSEYSLQWYKNNNYKELQKRKLMREVKNEELSNYHKEYRKNNLKRIKEVDKIYRIKNQERIKLVKSKWVADNQEYINKQKRQWDKDNKEKLRPIKREKERLRLANNINYRISKAFSHRLRETLKRTKNGCKWQSIVGYSIQELKIHLESLFWPGMTWGNYGEWHIDHIKPISAFSFISINDPEFKQCWVLSNLQPLWAKDNLSKGAKLVVNF